MPREEFNSGNEDTRIQRCAKADQFETSNGVRQTIQKIVIVLNSDKALTVGTFAIVDLPALGV